MVLKPLPAETFTSMAPARRNLPGAGPGKRAGRKRPEPNSEVFFTADHAENASESIPEAYNCRK